MLKLTLILAFACVAYALEPTVLTPPFFNLAYRRAVDATATCGYGLASPERYCKLTGADPTSGDNQAGVIIQGQLCDHCFSEQLAEQSANSDPSRRDYYNNRVHSPQNTVDGSERWWQSPPLSRGLQYNEVNLTIDLGQVFHVAYVFIKMANSPRPGVWALERSRDFGRTYTPWQYFADTVNDCYQFFSDEGTFSTTIERDNSVICSTRYSSVVPLENGEIAVSLVNGRPSASNFSYSSTLKEWTKATNVRLRLLQTKTLFGHLMAVRVDQDPTVTRRYFYSIRDISIGGRCVCNGHADVCMRDRYDPDAVEQTKLVCSCQHNTCGDECEVCCPGFVQKPWRPATPDSSNECEPCQCYGHTNDCVYDPDIARQRLSIDIRGRYEGGGVCRNCRHNTEGINCEKCVKGYYHPPGVPLDSPQTCQPCNCDLVFSNGECDERGRCLCRPQYTGATCDRCSYGYMNWPRCEPCECNLNGTLGAVCEARGGLCPCKPEFSGQYCNQCARGYWGYPNCQRCRCGGLGVLDGSCDSTTGHCVCKNNYAGVNCEQCNVGYFNFPACNLCNCDPNHTTQEVCDVYSGRCMCKENYAGTRCDTCASGYYRYPFCIACGCQSPGSLSTTCDDVSGQCRCKPNFAGQYCDKCAAGYYNYPACTACNCDTYGSLGTSCNQQTGQCDCKPTFMGRKCTDCRPNYYNYPNCEVCNCNPEGAMPVPGYPLGGCGTVTQGVLCECKRNVMGRICDKCKPGFWDLDRDNTDGCTDCGCFRPGTTGGQNLCNTENGQCVCKTFCDARRCDECSDGTYNLQEYNHFGCEDCACDVGGAVDHTCNKQTGQCPCRPRIDGTKCDRPISTHYFPTLFQLQYELEDGRTIRGGPVRYGYSEDIFPGYSWRGYAVMSRIQDEILINVDIDQPNLFKIVYHFVNRNDPTVTGEVTFTSEQPGIDEQSATVYFQATSGAPAFTTAVSEVYLTSGTWKVATKSLKTLFLDYMVLIPREYYEASVLQQPTYRVCRLPDDGQLCQHYVYVDVMSHPTAQGSEGTIRRANSQERTQLFPRSEITEGLGVDDMAHLNSLQTDVSMSIPLGVSGSYYLIITYYSSVEMRTQRLTVTPAGRASRGYLNLASCPYSSLCRQVVVDDMGNAKVFNFDSAFAAVTVSGQSDVNVAVESVVAIPAREWDLELIQPRLKCMRRNGDCIQSKFQEPTGTVKAEFEEGPNANLVADDIPPNIIDTTIRVIKLNGLLPVINVKASIDNPGPYAIIVHYFQPYELGFDVQVDVLTGRAPISGSFRANYCPSVSGCRAAVTFDRESLNGETLDLRNLDFVLTFNNSASKPIWLDYILVVPAAQFTDRVLQLRPEDKSRQFLQDCASQNFYIDGSTSAFCRSGVFSVTTEYNNGALPCGCNADGVTSFSCDQFGGQCRCKPNVIGRDCSRCRTGYYRFPDCLACNCPSGLCDDVTGQCICPPRVTGVLCDTCEPLTFGFDPLIGCEDCLCHPQGVRGGNLECNINDGQCDCRRETMGRRCDECRNGYYGFPRCSECRCNTAGTLPRICDPDTAQCVCKENVQGVECDACQQGTFYLEDRNPKGCTSCFCFGFTDRCTQSNLRRAQVRVMNGWGIRNVDRPQIVSGGGRVTVAINLADVPEPDSPHYWIAPGDYLDNKITSYGGKLSYSILFEGSGDSSIGPELRLQGSELTLVAYALDQPVHGVESRITIDILEANFENEDTGAFATREQLLSVLINLRSLEIRASYLEDTTRASIRDVSLDIATTTGSGDLAYNVEQCNCPRGYTGTSCERCDRGYYRSKDGALYLGQCVPCQCHGRADTCDPVTGACTNCRDDFEGPQCLTCREGHYYDEYIRTCQICSCPLPLESNNFAFSCEVSRRGETLRCLCHEGYQEPDCGSCSPGYWGNPLERGGSCRPCDCSGNINRNDRRSCDMFTGECLICINNAAGDRCERCREWYYGDAIDLKNCQACNCDQVGSQSCGHRNGVCQCKPNVVGPTCDRCDLGTFGFNSGTGCQQCNCAAAVYSTQCDGDSGQCQCKPGVTGRRCDQCERGYYSYSADGCRPCDCTSDGAVTCDPVSGRCECLPGVTGPKCDMCLPRWVMIPNQGCEECGNCIHTLLDDVEGMRRAVSNMTDNLQDISVGQDAIRRLNAINNTVNQLRPRVDDMEAVPTDPASLKPLKQDLEDLIDFSDDLRDDAHRLAREAAVVEQDATDLYTDARALDSLVDMAVEEADDAVQYAEEVLQDILNNIASANVAELLRQAEQILEDMKNRRFNDYNAFAEEELRLAIDLLRRAQSVHQEATDQAERTRDAAAEVAYLSAQLRDLTNQSRHTMDNAQAAMDLRVRTDRTIDEISFAAKDAEDKEAEARRLLELARNLLRDAEDAYRDVEREASQLDDAKQRLQMFADDLSAENRDLRPLVDRAMEHALGLRGQADMLDTAFADARHSAEGALNASNAYKNIKKAIDEAYDAAVAANEAGKTALNMSDGLAVRARNSRIRSTELDQDATDAKNYVTNQLRPSLENGVAAADALQQLNIETEDRLERLNDGLDMIQPGDYEQQAQDALDMAMDAQMRTEQARDRIRNVAQIEDRANELKILIEETNMGVMEAQDQIEDVKGLVPEMTVLLDSLESQNTQINVLQQQVKADLAALREKITISRIEANLIKVGVHFEQDTTLQVRNPQNLAEAGGYTQLSLFIKTDEADGFLAYIGPDAQPRPQYQDFLALEVIRGKVVITMDLGDGDFTLTNPRPVNDGKWHEVIMERVGKSATLTVRSPNNDTGSTDEPDSKVTGVSTRDKFVFDMNPETVKFYIGGVPDRAGLSAPNGPLTFTRFTGCVEDVNFDGLPVGLWNFVNGENNFRGCYRRDELQKTPPAGFRFGGNGYIGLAKDRFRPSRASRVEFRMRTYDENGLLFLMGDEETFGDYFAIELRDGKIVFQYDLGSGPATMESEARYNDGKWHYVEANRVAQRGLIKVDEQTGPAVLVSQVKYNDGVEHEIFANRDGKMGILKIDEALVDSGSSRGTQTELNVGDLVYIGGFPGQHQFPDVTNDPYEGCIDDLKLGSNGRDIADNEMMLDVVPGCVDTSRVVSFSAEVANSYISMEPISIDTDYTMTFKIRSTENEGLIFYATDDSAQQENAFSVVMKDGKIVLVVRSDGELPTMLESNLSYDDGRWHYITATKIGKEISLEIDDQEVLQTRYEGGRRRIETTTPLFFGGVRPGFGVVLANTYNVQSSFHGCIGDVTINGGFINFALSNPTDRAGVALSTCAVVSSSIETGPRPTAPPIVIPIDGDSRDQCALPRRPDLGLLDPVQAGTRFGGAEDSRWEFDALPSTFIDSSDFNLDFKTSATEGLLFFAGSSSTDFLTLYMVQGIVYFVFNCGAGRLVLQTVNTYNDNNWHTVEFTRVSRAGSLTLDGQGQVIGDAPGGANALNVEPPFFVGGVRGDANIGDKVPPGVTTFDGCIRNPQLNGFAFGSPDREIQTQPCTSLMETGTFFKDGPAYVKLLDNFVVGLDMEITVDIKPRTTSGVLLSVYNPENGEYLVLQLLNGDLIFNVNNGEGRPELVSTYEKITATNLCDGQWHSIHAMKFKNIIRMEVDGYPTTWGTGEKGVSQTNTNNPLYIGGVPARHAGIKTREDFVGCIRNITIEGQSYSLASGSPSDNVILNQCPTN